MVLSICLFFKQKTAYEMRISDWSSDVCSSDLLTAYLQPLLVVVLPETTEQVSRILAWCHAEGVKVVPRGSGTSLSGGALPLADAVLVGRAKFNRVLDIDYDDRLAVVQPGVTNLAVTQAVEDRGFYYAPDPSSQRRVGKGRVSKFRS